MVSKFTSAMLPWKWESISDKTYDAQIVNRAGKLVARVVFEDDAELICTLANSWFEQNQVCTCEESAYWYVYPGRCHHCGKLYRE